MWPLKAALAIAYDSLRPKANMARWHDSSGSLYFYSPPLACKWTLCPFQFLWAFGQGAEGSSPPHALLVEA